ncbi:Uncharacterized protein SCF082_LOCUS30781, partial [Durusdinium trenchii]
MMPRQRSLPECWEDFCPVLPNMAPDLRGLHVSHHLIGLPLFSDRPRCGLTCAHSSDTNGAVVSTQSSRGIPASRSAPPDNGEARATNAICGPTSLASSRKSGPDGSSSKTCPTMSASAQKPFSEPYGTWAGRLRLASSQRRKQARRTKESAGSAWPTPMAGTPAQNGNNAAGNSDFTRGVMALVENWPTPRASEQENRTTRSAPSHGKTHGLLLAGVAGDMMAQWPTPTPMQTREGWTAAEIEAARKREKAKGINGNGFGLGLGAAASMWTTPQAHDVTMRGAGQVPTSKAGNACLARDATQWPTPAGRDYKGENSPEHLENGTGRLHLDQLPNFVAFLFRHPHPMRPTYGVPSSVWRPISRRLYRFAMSNLSRTMRTRTVPVLGNGVYPLAAGYAWRTLSRAHGLVPVDLAAACRDPASIYDEIAGMPPDERIPYLVDALARARGPEEADPLYGQIGGSVLLP